MSADFRSRVDEYVLDGTVWQCWVVKDDQHHEHGQAYVWRSTCGRFEAGRSNGICWSTCDGVRLNGIFTSLRDAMAAVQRRAIVRGAAA